MLRFNQRMLGVILVVVSILLVILLSLIKIDIDKQGVFACTLVSENPNINMADCPAHKSNSSWFISIGFGVSFIIFVVGLYFIFSKPRVAKTKQETEFKEIDISKLDEEEKRIYDILKQRRGSAYQSDLIKETGFSKVKVTRILDRMATKGIVDRNRRGMTNIVVLK